MEIDHIITKAGVIHHIGMEGLSRLDFYEDELGILEERLWELSCKYTSFELRDQVTDFKEEIIIQRRQAEELKSACAREEQDTTHEREQQEKPASPELRKIKEIRDKVIRFEKEVNELWVRVNDFLSKWMENPG